jgi:hypothetical protein
VCVCVCVCVCVFCRGDQQQQMNKPDEPKLAHRALLLLLLRGS